MRLVFVFLLGSMLFLSCNNHNKVPDVSNISIELKTLRFEKDLFQLDTTDYTLHLEKLIAGYPSFGENFLSAILNTDPAWPADSSAAYVKGFTNAYKPVFDSAAAVFKDFRPYEKEIRKGLQFVKYYFPEYKIPNKIITYIGPLDGYGDILSDDAIIVGLHHHLGKQFSLYQTALVQETYPTYISNRFEPGYIAVNCMKNMVLDLYPEKMDDKSLIEQMIEKGKRLYLLNKLLPQTEAHMLIGYTANQFKDVVKHEKVVWDLFVQNNFLRTTDRNIIKNYIGEGPKTQELGEASPGNIGSFAGWQIVNKFMNQYPKTTLSQLMAMEAENIFQMAKYKP